ncbi:MAG TPA: thermonuclease family protein [Myxococcota bacterium]|nr:thermonuclease family protein [Myxococcota bacterium]
MTTNRILPGLLTAALLALVARGVRAELAAPPLAGPCRAIRAHDGDSADLRCNGALVRVRLRDVATPRPGEIGYNEATRALAELLRARELWFASDEASPRDASGRRLVYLYDGRGANLNVELVALGWATYSADGGAGRLEHSFRAAESEARSDNRALWTIWSVTARGMTPP